MENTINVDHRQILSTAKIVGHHNPHPIARVRLIAKYRTPMDKSTLVQLTTE